jgi:chromosome segregation protein
VLADITALQADLTTANEDKIRAIAEAKRLDDLRQSCNTAVNDFIAEQSANSQKVEVLKSSSQTIATQIADIEAKKTSIEAEINSMTGGRDNLNATRESLTNDITALKLSLIEFAKDIESLILSKDNLNKSILERSERVVVIDSEIAALQFKNENLKNEIATVTDGIEELKNKIEDAKNAIADFVERRNQTEKAGVELRNSERENTLQREKISGELARLTERKEVMLREYDDVIRRLYDEYELTRTEAEKIGIEIENPVTAKKDLTDIKNKIRGLGNVNVSAIEEYKEVSERYNFLSSQINDVEATRAQLHKLINQLTSQMQEIFVEGFQKINQNFSKTFTELFGGGNASLTLSDPENILESGIDINVKLPGKSVPSLDGLSGGEKALIALSIYFAIMRVNAPPFCFLDEVDTALDDINVDRFADYMRSSDFATQFICVTHRRGTMESADMLYGVTMQEKGVTKLLELNVSELEKTLLEN